MIITLSGLPGAGKSTIRNLLAEKLGLKKYSMGDMRGEMAKARGITIDELNAIGMTDASTDNEVDQFQETLGKTQDDFVIDSWLGWHFIPHSKKIFLTVDSNEAAKRIFEDRKNNPSRDDEPEYATAEDAKRVLAERVESTRARAQKWYGVDFMDMSKYDLVIDTTHLTREEVLQKILDFVSPATS